MTDLPKTQFVIIFFHDGKPFSVTVDNSGCAPVIYDLYRDDWIQLSHDEIGYYLKRASKIITSEEFSVKC